MGHFNDKKKPGDAPIDRKSTEKPNSFHNLYLMHPESIEYFSITNHIPFQSNQEIANLAERDELQQAISEQLARAALLTSDYISSDSSRDTSDNDETPLFMELVSPSPVVNYTSGALAGSANPFIAALTGVDSSVAVKG